jgi:hypothetical protein
MTTYQQAAADVAFQLTALGIPYEREYIFRGPSGQPVIAVDFWLPRHSAVIALDAVPPRSQGALTAFGVEEIIELPPWDVAANPEVTVRAACAELVETVSGSGNRGE